MEKLPHYTKNSLVYNVAKELAIPVSKATAITDCVLDNFKNLIISGDITISGFMSVKHKVKHMPEVVLNGNVYPARKKRTIKISIGKNIKDALKEL